MVRDVETGFRDPNDLYPRKSSMFKQDSDLPPGSVQRNALSGTWIEQRLARQDISVPLTFAGIKNYGFWSEPKPDYNAEYPYNKTYTSESGHVKEVDDTPGHERLNWQHRLGTYVEIDSNGNEVRKVIGSNYEIVCGDDFVYIKGKSSVTVDGSHHLLVLGDAYTEIAGNENKLVRGDSYTKIAGDQIVEVGGDSYHGVKGDNQTRVEGNQAIESLGWTYNWSKGQFVAMTQGKMTLDAKESIRHDTEGGYTIAAGDYHVGAENIEVQSDGEVLVAAGTLTMGSQGEAELQAVGDITFAATTMFNNSTSPSPVVPEPESPEFSFEESTDDTNSDEDPFGASVPKKSTSTPKTVLNTWKEGIKDFVERVLQ